MFVEIILHKKAYFTTKKEATMSVTKIKKLIKQKGMNVKLLGDKTGYSRIHISNVIHGHFKSPKAREAIAHALNIEPQKLWGIKDSECR